MTTHVRLAYFPSPIIDGWRGSDRETKQKIVDYIEQTKDQPISNEMCRHIIDLVNKGLGA